MRLIIPALNGGFILPSPYYRFEGFELDLKRYELRRNGHILKLEKIPMELLILLISRNGELVSREEIVAKLWGQDVFVETEHGVNTAIRKIRQTLGDDTENSRFVQTVIGKGYRFAAKVTSKADETAVPKTSEQKPVASTESVAQRKGRKLWQWAVAAILSLALIGFGANALGVRTRLLSILRSGRAPGSAYRLQSAAK